MDIVCESRFTLNKQSLKRKLADTKNKYGVTITDAEPQQKRPKTRKIILPSNDSNMKYEEEFLASLYANKDLKLETKKLETLKEIHKAIAFVSHQLHHLEELICKESVFEQMLLGELRARNIECQNQNTLKCYVKGSDNTEYLVSTLRTDP